MDIYCKNDIILLIIGILKNVTYYIWNARCAFQWHQIYAQELHTVIMFFSSYIFICKFCGEKKQLILVAVYVTVVCVLKNMLILSMLDIIETIIMRNTDVVVVVFQSTHSNSTTDLAQGW